MTGNSPPASDSARGRPEASSKAQPLDPIFVGGAGRSGTTILARLIGEHSRYHMIPFEIRFHTGPLGLAELLADKVPLNQFLARLRGYWWTRSNATGETLGLHTITSEEAFEAAIERFKTDWVRDRLEACRALIRSLIDPYIEEVGKPGWIEMSPPNVKAAPTLASLFGGMKLIHIVRDGRDVASSSARFAWGSDSMREGIVRWADVLREAELGARQLPPGQVAAIRMEDLVVERRQETYERVLEFLGLPDEPGMRSFFETGVDADRAHIGRWKKGLSRAEQAEVVQFYESVLAGLHRDGISLAPALENGHVSVCYPARESVGTFIIFGPDLPPLEASSAREGAPEPRRRRDGITVKESPEEVASKLATANTPWPQFTQERGRQEGQAVYINPATVRYVVDSGQ